MNLKPTRRQVRIGLVIAAVAVLGVVAVTGRRPGSAVHQARATYYCPMHPTYTSDRPGDCPICNMKLVKREPAPASKQFESICYLHNCPKLHEGRPCPMTVVAKPGEKVTCPICGTHIAEAAEQPAGQQQKKILYWTDPMIPGYRSEEPGKSPMGMDLVPVYEEATAGAAAEAPQGYTPVLISPQKQQLIGVTTAPVTRRPLTKTIRTVGRIAYDPELYQAEQEYLQALNTLMQAAVSDSRDVKTQAERLVEASRIRLRLLGLSEELINGMATWEAPDRRLLGTDPSGEVWLYASIYEFELPLVRAGQTVEVEMATIPGKRLSGVIRAIDPVLDPSTRAARVRAVLADPDRVLKPEMFVNAFINVPLGEVLAVPEAAVLHTGTAHLVFVDKGQGLLEPREVVMGVTAEGYTEVRSGVAEGEPVVTSGNFLIDSESRLKAALQGAGGAGHQHGQ
ncbi:MAG: efflux RND transporter periplasmic adaptor subunit [Candidatus Omnitrophica bacterium]|nr:efflux RND transporter periplasmic adaptor subunit [Candidatus Omnitrophota bacterium]